MNAFLCYNIAHLLFNAFILSCYAVMIFGVDKLECITKGDNNITRYFSDVYKAGFGIIILDTLNTNCLYIYYRFKVKLEKLTWGEPT